MKDKRSLILWIIVIGALFIFVQLTYKYQFEKELSYSEFKNYLKQGTIRSVKIRSDLIRGKFINPETQSEENFKTVTVPDLKLVEDMDNAGVSYQGEPEKGWLSALLANLAPLIIFIVLWFFMIKQMQGGGKQVFAFGRSRAKLQSTKQFKTTFADVAGCDEAKEELQEIIEFLKNPAKFQKLGGKIPKGVLLVGQSGTGKTLLAKAIAGEAAVPFFSSSGSEFVEMFVGVGASRVRDLFEQGRKSAPCLLFVDEIDAVGRHRFAGMGGGHDEREQTLNQLLVEMDGFDTKEGVILLAATNRPDVLDRALLRPGRFDRHIVVPVPDLKSREEILKVHARHIKLNQKVDFSVIAKRTPGMVGADLANLINESALLAARRNKEAVEMIELEEAIERIIAGPERRSCVISEKEKKIIAYHESGHALVAKLIPNSEPIHKISIIPRGMALGYTIQLPTEDKYLRTQAEIVDKVTALLGGRAAEKLIFNDVTTGAQNDLLLATDFAQRMVCEYGMSEKIGPLTLRKREEEVFLGKDIMTREKMYSESTAREIDEEVKRIIEECFSRAEKIIKENISSLHSLAKKLIEREILTGEEVEKYIKKDETAN